MIEQDKAKLAHMIDHTKLIPYASQAEIVRLCEEAREHNFFSVCVNGEHTRFAADQLLGSEVRVCTVVGFPLGASSPAVKAFEAKQAVLDGAAEIDMVINIGALRDRNPDRVKADIMGVVEASRPALVKVILETCYLTDDEIVSACRLSIESGAHFVKTSTGFGPYGAFEEHVQLMRRTVGSNFGVKASGGIRNLSDAWRMIRSGANRLGTSGGIAILAGLDVPPGDPQTPSPCLTCPSHYASRGKQPQDVYESLVGRCPDCPHQDSLKLIETQKSQPSY